MTPRVSIVTFKYDMPGYRTRFTAHMVNSLYKQFAENAGPDCPFEFVCITDDPSGIMGDIFTRRMRPTFLGLRNPTSPSRPNCYPRLDLLDPSNPYGLQEYFLAVDLDALVVGRIDNFIQHWKDFIVYKVRGRFCGSMFGGRVGGHGAGLFLDFDPERSPAATHAAGLRGSDQAWFEFKMPEAATWEAKDGCMGWQDDIGFPFGYRRASRLRVRQAIQIPSAAGRPARLARPARVVESAVPSPARNPAILPPHSRIVHFYGSPKHWDIAAMEASPWIRKFVR